MRIGERKRAQVAKCENVQGLLREKRQEGRKSVMRSAFRAGRAISRSTRLRPGPEATMARPRIKTRLSLLLPNWMLSPSSFSHPEPNEPASISAQHQSTNQSSTPESHHPHTGHLALPLFSLLITLLYLASSPPLPGPACALFLSALLALSLCLPRTQEGLAVSDTQNHAPRIVCRLGRTHSCTPDFSSARGFFSSLPQGFLLRRTGHPRCRLDHTPQESSC